MKPTLEALHVSYVYPVRRVQQKNMFTHRPEIIDIPDGAYHLFEVTVAHIPRVAKPGEEDKNPTKKMQKVETASAFSMCGKTRSEIGATVVETKTSPHNKICPGCEEKYKADPRSSWYSLINGTGIKV